MSLSILKKIEARLKVENNDPNYTLADHYDLIGGTSTGAIIASCLAIGKKVDEIIELYQTLGKEVFYKNKWIKKTRNWTIRAFFKENYDSALLAKKMRAVLGDIALGDQDILRCGLVINCKRADTYSLWTLANHPEGRYYNANKHLKLWELCRASSAAPSYFKPMKLQPKDGKGNLIDMTFIDGGVSLANNPAWQLFLVVKVPSFGFNWKVGADQLTITSIGTGNGVPREDADSLAKLRTISWASKIPNLFMIDANEMNQVILQAFGKNVGPTVFIDSQYGDMQDADLVKEKLFSFARYNVDLTPEYLEELGLSYSTKKIESIWEMDHFENLDEWLEIGKRYADSIFDS